MSNKVNTPFIGRTLDIPTTLNQYVKGAFQSIFTASTPVTGADVRASMQDGYMTIATISSTKQKFWWLDNNLSTWHLYDLAANSLEAPSIFTFALDTPSSGTLNIGTSNATNGNIGKLSTGSFLWSSTQALMSGPGGSKYVSIDSSGISLITNNGVVIGSVPVDVHSIVFLPGSAIYPQSDNDLNLGFVGSRWKEIYGVSIYSGTFDRKNSGSLTFGATNATSISIGRSGVATSIVADLNANGNIILAPAHNLSQNFGLGSTTPSGFIKLGSDLNSGDFFRAVPATTGSVPWNMGVVAYDQSPSNPNPNNVMTMGWNAGTQGPIDPTKGTYSFTVESEYGPTGGAQMEYYMGYTAPNGAVSYRLLTVNSSLSNTDGYSTNVGLVGTQVGIGVGTSINDANRVVLSNVTSKVNAPSNYGSLSMSNNEISLSASNSSNVAFLQLNDGYLQLRAADGYIGGADLTNRFVWHANNSYVYGPNNQNRLDSSNADIRLRAGSVSGVVLDAGTLTLDTAQDILVKHAGTTWFKLGTLTEQYSIFSPLETAKVSIHEGNGVLMQHVGERVSVVDAAGIIFRTNNVERARFDYSSLRPSSNGTFDLGQSGASWRHIWGTNLVASYLTDTTEASNYFIPTGSGNYTLVADTLMQTLTNKTLTSPAINTMTLDGYSVNASTTSTGKALVYNGSAYIPQAISQQRASTSDFLLVDTSAHTVVAYTPSLTSNYIVYFYYRVITATTNITVTISWTDGSGAQTATVISASPQAVGSYGAMPTYINAASGNPITVTATAGTANQIYMSASIVQL